MKINILTLFPDYFDSALASSIIGRAQDAQRVELHSINIRDFAPDAHQMTDDRPYGGGPGMVMMVEPIARALESLGLLTKQFEKKNNPEKSRIVLTSAKGSLFNQQTASTYSQLDELTIICGHYEGVDERVVQLFVDDELRIGDYVLTGGEPAALVMADAIIRLIPGVLGNEQSSVDESHMEPGKLGYPQYTRPEIFSNLQVPSVLLSGNHAAIQEWRQLQKKGK